jgi:hypothetical protein
MLRIPKDARRAVARRIRLRLVTRVARFFRSDANVEEGRVNTGLFT